MRGPALKNSIKTAIPAHLWPLKMDENCDALLNSYLVRIKAPTALFAVPSSLDVFHQEWTRAIFIFA
jgi:hypothetical protein